jgi:hypothetical protein
MSRRLKQRPDPEAVLKFRTEANVLSRILERELIRLIGHQQVGRLKGVYDTVYLPTAAGLAEGLQGVDFNVDLNILRQPLCEALAPTQLRIVLELLYNFVEVLSEK